MTCTSIASTDIVVKAMIVKSINFFILFDLKIRFVVIEQDYGYMISWFQICHELKVLCHKPIRNYFNAFFNSPETRVILATATSLFPCIK